jgi:NADH-quinone oxidoreductase subunit M
MILLILLLIPFVSGLFILFIRKAATARIAALTSALVNLLLTFYLIFSGNTGGFIIEDINYLGLNFELNYDGISLLMLLLTNLLFPFIIFSGFCRNQKQIPVLNALILFTQSALIGVFLVQNAFLFYMFWELTLIPIYFILLLWGGENRNAITLKFFIYTVTGSLFLLFGIIYLYHLTPAPHTTDFAVLGQLNIDPSVQIWLFWILFIAFAIKMPVFPFHSWQPSTYTMASTQGVMILGGVMTKMGIYGALRFLFPIVPVGVEFWQHTIIVLSLIGVIYASIIAYRQTNLKKLLAFSSMAHISLMVAAMFAVNYYALQGLLFQVISHGVIIVALFYIAMVIKDKTRTVDLSQLGGLKLLAPKFAIVMLIAVLGSIALPLTAGFVGEFLIMTGLFNLSIWYAAIGGLAMILGAIYMLYAYQKVMLGEAKTYANAISDMSLNNYLILIPLLAIIIGLGVYPQPILNMTEDSINLLQHFITKAVDSQGCCGIINLIK